MPQGAILETASVAKTHDIGGSNLFSQLLGQLLSKHF